MKLARKPHTAGATIRYEIDYSNWLADGDTLVANQCTVTIPTVGATATVTGLAVLSQHLYFFVNGGAVSEVFTVAIAIKDTRGETDLDTVDYFVIAP